MRHLTLLLFVSLLRASSAAFTCPSGWELGDKSCFKTIIRGSAFTYKEYQNHCKELDSLPAAVDSEHDLAAINRASNTSVTTSGLPEETFIIYIGALNSNEGKFPPKFYWEKTKKTIENDDERWYPGQPNPLSKMNPGILEENCLMYSWEHTGADQTVLYRDYPCDCKIQPKNCRWQIKGIVCQKDAEQK